MSVVRYAGVVQTNVTTLQLPEPGAFNGAMLPHPVRNAYICVYRCDTRSFAACDLTPDLDVVQETSVRLNLSPCVDPRLIAHAGRVWLFFSVPAPDVSYECICVAELETAAPRYRCDRVFPLTTPDWGRQKSWMPFVAAGGLHIVSHVNPHTVWRIDALEKDAPTLVKVAQAPWQPPAPWGGALRGNACPLRLDATRFLGTFHDTPLRDGVADYENGCYIFHAEPPFHVLACGTTSYLSSGDARAPCLRRRGQIRGTFPLSFVPDGDEVLISYGDNDSAVKVLRTTRAALLDDVRPVEEYPAAVDFAFSGGPPCGRRTGEAQWGGRRDVVPALPCWERDDE